MTIVLSAAARSSRNFPRRANSASGSAAVAISRQAIGRRTKKPASSTCTSAESSSTRCSSSVPGEAGSPHRFPRATAAATASSRSAPSSGAIQRHQRRRRTGRTAGRRQQLAPSNGLRRPGAAGRCRADRPTARCCGWRRPIRPAAAPAASPAPGRSADRPDTGRRPPGGSGGPVRATRWARLLPFRQLRFAVGRSRRLVRRVDDGQNPKQALTSIAHRKETRPPLDQPAVFGQPRNGGHGGLARQAPAAAGRGRPPRRPARRPRGCE